jgi:signal transduction histidine kinase
MEPFRQRAWLAWASVGVLATLCAVLAVLQYRWIGEITAAERTQLGEQLQVRLGTLSRAFNDQISNACAALEPAGSQIEQVGVEKAYTERYLQFRESHEPLFRRIALVPRGRDSTDLLLLDLTTGKFARAEWPAEWAPIRQRILARREGGPPGPMAERPGVIELPRFALPGSETGPGEQPRLLVEPDLNYMAHTLIPAYLSRYLGSDYDAEVVAAGAGVIYASSPGISLENRSDGSISLMNVRPNPFGGRRGGRGFREGWERTPGGRGPMLPEPGQGRWLLLVRHRAGSLDVLVAQTRMRNLAVSAGILLLILAATAVLVRAARRAQQLADLQMNFVANVSHELRTPLTVIRTAAFNLRGRLASRPDQVERYGSLIQAESERLETMLEQVLRFASASAGHAIREREPVAVENLIDEGLRSSRASEPGAAWHIERCIEPGLPFVLADQVALRHALRNLIDNAIKYGTEGNTWIGVYASAVSGDGGPAVEIRVADHGPGIPADEQAHIFDPFFRGRRAIQDQVHGTGLGLNLVKRIVEAHGGTIRVMSQPMQGAVFIVRIPAAPPELQDEFAHTAD